MGTLNELGLKYKTDKSSTGHGYLDAYEKYFEPLKDKKLNVLEIGVFNGASVKMWSDYFINSQIFGIDYVDKSKYDAEKIKTIIADQANREQLTKVFQDLPEMDIIIDDGGHTMEQQQVSLGVLFPYLKDGGIYVIEDLGSSRPKWARIYNKEKTSKTTRWMIDNFIETKKIDSEYITPEEATYVEEKTSSCKMGTFEIVFIEKSIKT